MTSYTTRKPKSWWHIDQRDEDASFLEDGREQRSIIAMTPDDEPQETGLYDHTGAPLYRITAKRKTGFIG